jgi:hypothetical protein
MHIKLLEWMAKNATTQLNRSNVVKWQQYRQKMYLQKSKRIDVNEDRIPPPRKEGLIIAI